MIKTKGRLERGGEKGLRGGRNARKMPRNTAVENIETKGGKGKFVDVSFFFLLLPPSGAQLEKRRRREREREKERERERERADGKGNKDNTGSEEEEERGPLTTALRWLWGM